MAPLYPLLLLLNAVVLNALLHQPWDWAGLLGLETAPSTAAATTQQEQQPAAPGEAAKGGLLASVARRVSGQGGVAALSGVGGWGEG